LDQASTVGAVLLITVTADLTHAGLGTILSGYLLLTGLPFCTVVQQYYRK